MQSMTYLMTVGRLTLVELPARLGHNALEARLPLAVGQLLPQLARLDELAGLAQVLGTVPEDLGVGRLGLEGGPQLVVTNLAVLDFHPESRHLRIESVHPGVSVIAEDVWDLTALHRARGDGRLAEALAREGPAPGAAVPRKLWHSSGGSAGR